MNWDLVFKVIAAIGAVLGAWALLRSYWLTRSKLRLAHKSSKGHTKFHDRGQEGLLSLTVLVSNLSSQGNTVTQWKAWLKTRDGQMKALEIMQGHSQDAETKVIDYEFNVTPLNVMPHGTISSQMHFFHIRREDFANPFELKVEATDMYGKKYSCICRYAHVG
jgi:hypothetical protein